MLILKMKLFFGKIQTKFDEIWYTAPLEGTNYGNKTSFLCLNSDFSASFVFFVGSPIRVKIAPFPHNSKMMSQRGTAHTQLV